MANLNECENCTYYSYDGSLDEYVCLVILDEDEYSTFISRNYKSCPYFRPDDEYGIVRKQM